MSSAWRPHCVDDQVTISGGEEEKEEGGKRGEIEWQAVLFCTKKHVPKRRSSEGGPVRTFYGTPSMQLNVGASYKFLILSGDGGMGCRSRLSRHL